ncbi:MAG: 2-dehydro-3-deoxygluconokinase [Planctomycetes bacterium ADurb.Bin126]|nr:MAG: 2-dehydro-3-deoxygluconokinase [Planctomycetes bacterium ADurb.Bin126]HOD80490.1 carbohydrate kinase family protein [Phycisphaerae bacterium]HQL72102.1 carbohydrate kinase family protein [Phycisphaerae bacterium]
MADESIFRGRRLAIVGSICRDIRIAPLHPGPHLLEDGETPTAGIVETVGGGGANSALAGAALGAEVRFGGKVGDDSLGTRLEQALIDRGVRTFIRREAGLASGSSVVLSYDSSSRHFISCQPNNYTLSMGDVDPALLDGADHLLRADVWFSEPMLAGGNEDLLRAAGERGLAVSLDINWDPQWDRAEPAVVARRQEAVRRLLPLVDLVHGNVGELNRFAGCEDLEATLRRLAGWGAGAVVVHMGAAGAGYFREGKLIVSPAAPVERHQNTAGTGDLLSVCMMLLHGRDDVPPHDRLRLANTIVAQYIEGRRDFFAPLAF